MLIKYMIVISVFSPGNDLITKYTEGPLNTKHDCVIRLKELKQHPNLYGLKNKMRCVKYDKDKTYASLL